MGQKTAKVPVAVAMKDMAAHAPDTLDLTVTFCSQAYPKVNSAIKLLRAPMFYSTILVGRYPSERRLR